MNATRATKRILAGGLAVLFLLAASALFLFGIDSCKPGIETAASEAAGMEVRIGGKLTVSLFPLGLSARNVRVTGGAGQILAVERLGVALELLPLLRGQFRISGCSLAGPSAAIVKEKDGRYNFAKGVGKPPGRAPGGAFRLKDFRLSDGSLVYRDERTGKTTELKGLQLALRDLSLAGSAGGFLKNLSFTGTAAWREVTRNAFRIGGASGAVKAGQGVLLLDLPILEVFGARGEGSLRVDAAGTDIEYRISLKAPNADFGKLTGSFGADRLIGGRGDLFFSLTVKEKEGRILPGGTDGMVSLRGSDLTTPTVDLEKVLSSYAATQEFNLADVGAYFIAGPLGSAALSAYRYGDLYYRTRGGQGAIRQFVSRWQIKNGIADAVDCALATRTIRVALKGKLDFTTERYDGITVAILDERGCAKFTQGISGPFGSPRAGALGSLAGPVLSLYRKAERFAQGGKCEPFYRGSLPHPR